MRKILTYKSFVNESDDSDDTVYDEDGGTVTITGSIEVDDKPIDLKDTVFKVRANKHKIVKLVPNEKGDIPAIEGLKAEDLHNLIGKKLESPIKLNGNGVDKDNKKLGTVTLSIFELKKDGSTQGPQKPPLPPKLDMANAKPVVTDKGHEQILAEVEKALKSGGKMMKLPGNEKGTYQIIITGVKV